MQARREPVPARALSLGQPDDGGQLFSRVHPVAARVHPVAAPRRRSSSASPRHSRMLGGDLHPFRHGELKAVPIGRRTWLRFPTDFMSRFSEAAAAEPRSLRAVAKSDQPY